MGKVVIYTSSISFNPKTRNHTGNLKYILESKGIEYEEVDLAVSSSSSMEEVAKVSGERTLPQLHVVNSSSENKFIGGYEAVQEMEDAGCLTEALQAASAA